MRIFIIESFDDTTGAGLAHDIQTNTSFIFDRAGLADEMDGVAFPGEYILAVVVGDRITNLSATERPDVPIFLEQFVRAKRQKEKYVQHNL